MDILTLVPKGLNNILDLYLSVSNKVDNIEKCFGMSDENDLYSCNRHMSWSSVRVTRKLNIKNRRET